MTGTTKNAHTWERSEYEWYVDPPSCADALFKVEQFHGLIMDPCCGMGNILRMAGNHGYRTLGFDISGRYPHWEKTDFFRSFGLADNVVFNPPYGRSPDGGLRLEERAIVHAVGSAKHKVAALLHLKWMASRLDWLKANGCVRIWALTPRPSMLPGANILAGEMPGGGSQDYAWYVFEKGAQPDSIAIAAARRDRTLDKPDAWSWRLDEVRA